MPRIFLSYKREDVDLVFPIAKRLAREGFDYWWDKDIPPNAPWEQTIEKNIEQCAVVVVFWSAQSVESENVKAEARFGRKRNVLVQAFLDKTEPPLFFGERQGIDLSRATGDADSPGINALIDHLRERITPRIREQKESAASAPSGVFTLFEALSWQSQQGLQRLCKKLSVEPPNWRTKNDMAAAVADAQISSEIVLETLRGDELSLILFSLGKRSTGLSKEQMVLSILDEFA